MSYRSRVYRQRNPQQTDRDSKEQDKFFTRSTEKSKGNGTKNAFFQAKSNDTTGADDALEKQAEQQAASVPNQEQVKDKKDEAIQKLAMPEEDKQTSTNDERQKNDKEKQT